MKESPLGRWPLSGNPNKAKLSKVSWGRAVLSIQHPGYGNNLDPSRNQRGTISQL